ncbi:glycosyltransferase [Bacillus toyonensis]|uniref:glycosyltransferase n=1 Tax=Bacillus toyonensis TaxID=155322 RepID=UPI00211A74DB|nr:glycosyltransferase [Bacillus toyonensis]MED3197981.1 glycosyltransferase [Bacillus toyonensis]
MYYLNKPQKWLVFLLFFFFVILLGYINFLSKGTGSWTFGIYGSIMVCYLLGKMILSFFYKPYTEEPLDLKVSVFIPSYNENPEAVVKTIQSILNQDKPVHELFFVDDGSPNPSGYQAALQLKEEWERTHKGSMFPRLIVHRLEKNLGKRHAQIWGFKQATGDIFFTVDSDGYVYPNALKELLRPFNNPRVMAVTGHINARNRNKNFLTKLLDMRYDNAFRVERAAQSVTGNILVCSGPISCYRKEVVLDNLEHYGNHTFLGDLVQSGDDRCLTNYAILKGKTVYQETAKCDTDVPETFRQFLKQQIRWNKSFFRESLQALRIGFQKPKILIWVILELSLWILFGFVILLSVFLKAKIIGYVLLVYYLMYLAISAYARNVYYIWKHPFIFLLAPVYGLIHLGLLFPLRLYALLTIKVNGWGTR